MAKQSKSVQNANDAVAASVGRMYDRASPMLICEALLFAACGVGVLVWPVVALTVLTVVVGIGLVLFGLYRTISGFAGSRGFGGGWLDALFGVINIALGVVFCIYPVGSIIGVTYIFVVLFLFKSLRALVFAINMWRARFGRYKFHLIMSVFLVALAVALLFWPMAGAIGLVYYMGITMLLYAVADIYMFIELRRLKKYIEY